MQTNQNQKLEEINSEKELISFLFSKVCTLNNLLQREHCYLSKEDRKLVKLNESTTAETSSLIIEMKNKYGNEYGL